VALTPATIPETVRICTYIPQCALQRVLVVLLLLTAFPQRLLNWALHTALQSVDAVAARKGWADRMWEVLKKETAVQKGKTALRVDVANTVRRLWKADGEDGRIPAWAPGTAATDQGVTRISARVLVSEAQQLPPEHPHKQNHSLLLACALLKGLGWEGGHNGKWRFAGPRWAVGVAQLSRPGPPEQLQRAWGSCVLLGLSQGI
jgi:hypothetical protein